MTASSTHPEESRAHRGRDDLSQLLLSEHTVSELLDTIVGVAVGTLPGIAGVSVSMATRSRHGFETANASSDMVREVDEVQYETGAGPCVEAIRSGSEIRTSLPSIDWPEFSAAAERGAMTAVWSLPLRVHDRVTGALNLYSTERGPWANERADAARLLARQASAVLANAAALAESQHVTDTLKRALETRTVIGQAQGVLMARQGITPDQAFDVLRRASQRTNRKLREVAEDIVAGVRGGPHGG